MLFCIMLWFAAQPSLFVPRTIDHGFIISANEMYFKPRVPPPLIDPELIDFEAENVESYRDRLL